jgi:replicative superfamily II helicase
VIDFKKKLGEKQLTKRVHPVEIYDTLDRRSETSALRPAQSAILQNWYTEHKDDKDVIIKLHTGEGKTLIGLLILQSKLNARSGACLYICPTKQLVEQVCAEAEKFGVAYCTFPDSGEIPAEFESGDKILITHAHKLFNGLSKFGVGHRYQNAGAIVIDDAHACIDVIRSAFTIEIDNKKSKELYGNLLKLFENDLTEQGEGSLLDIKNGKNELMLVPYWSWSTKQSAALKYLGDSADNTQVMFAWQLIKDDLINCACYISESKIEIVPYAPNVALFSTFSRAKNRILMSATTQDDSFFIKGLGFSLNAVTQPLQDNTKKWSGEKMLLLPSLMHDECDHDLVVTRLLELKHPHSGIVAIVPSQRKANQYTALGAVLATTNTLNSEISKLRRGECDRTLVIGNRYDGIDLPDNSCRILIIDSLPYFVNLADRYEEECRPDSDILNTKLAQKIEQGLGRAVRGEKDFCVVVMIGSDLVKFTRSTKTNKYFSPQTMKQIEIGLEIAKMANADTRPDSPAFETVWSTMTQCLKRDDGWKEYYVSEMNTVISEVASSKLYERLMAENEIELCVLNNDFQKAAVLLQKYIDNYCKDDGVERGWYLQQLARYTHMFDKTKANEIQKSAFRANHQLLKPKDGISYNKVSFVSGTRIARIRKFIGKYGNNEELRLGIDDILDKLDFGIEAKKFEAAIQSLGELLGYESQRPDKEIRKGFDNLWCGVNNCYELFECKSEVLETREAINKHEVGQMNNHIAWFRSVYGESTAANFYMIAATKDFTRESDLSENIRVIRKSKLNNLKKNIRAFVTGLSKYVLSDLTVDELQNLLDTNALGEDCLHQHYSEEPFHLTK